jgi:steroid 5-alpha reductase family enzyme
MIVSNTLILIWGLRMAIHVALRTELGKEDRRFANLRIKLK